MAGQLAIKDNVLLTKDGKLCTTCCPPPCADTVYQVLDCSINGSEMIIEACITGPAVIHLFLSDKDCASLGWTKSVAITFDPLPGSAAFTPDTMNAAIAENPDGDPCGEAGCNTDHQTQNIPAGVYGNFTFTISGTSNDEGADCGIFVVDNAEHDFGCDCGG